MQRFRFYHEDMPVYGLAVALYGDVVALASKLPWHARWLSDQLLRAAGSTVLNLAEGAGEHSPAEKARFYRMALRSASETAAALDLVRKHLPGQAPALDTLSSRTGDVARMLTALAVSTARRKP